MLAKLKLSTKLSTPRKQKCEKLSSTDIHIHNNFPPLPVSSSSSSKKIPRSFSYSNNRDDVRTVGTTISPSSSSSSPSSSLLSSPSPLSPSEFSFQTPSTTRSSPGRYAWSTSSKREQGEKQGLKFVVDGIPPSPSPSPLPSPMRRTRSWRQSHSPSNSTISTTRYNTSHTNHTQSTPNKITPSRHSARSASPSSKFSTIKFKKNESILDLTDSEDEGDGDDGGDRCDEECDEDEDSVVEDTSLRQLIRVTSHTLSEEGKVLEEESFIALQPTTTTTTTTTNQSHDNGDNNDDNDDNDGLNRELRQLKNNEHTFHNEINFAIDKVAYGHKSTIDLNDKFVSNQGKVVNIKILDDVVRKEDKGYDNFMDKIIGMCICCTGTVTSTDTKTS